MASLRPAFARPVFVRGAGSHVWDRDGRRYLDAISGAFCVNFGYTAPNLVIAMRKAAETLPFARPSASDSEEGEAYREALLALVGPPFARVVLTSSGSEAVEAAMKIAIVYQRALGRGTRTAVRSLAGHFHGATFGALGVSGWDERRAPWADLLGPRLDGPPEPGDESAALIAETIPVAGAGVVIPAPGELSKRRAACDATGALWIADEVLTGFGRCGSMFAWQRVAERKGGGGGRPDAGAIPDLVVFGKGAGGGFAALAGVLLSARVADALDSEAAGGGPPFTHYQTYGGNPIACAVGRAVLRSLEEDQWFARVRGLEDPLRPVVEGAGEAVEILGMLGGFTPPSEGAGPGAAAHAADYAGRGVLVHAASGNRCVVAPPFPISGEDLDELRVALRATSPRGT
jgi:beta-alanine--pyruvate transaminase